MKLVRIHAYEVTPQRLAAKSTPPRGGAFSPDAAFLKSLDEFLAKSNLASQPTVDSRFKKGAGPEAGKHEVRGLVVNYTFGTPPRAKSSAISLATRLGKSMDDRSPFTLLMLAAYSDGDTRRLIIWAFPKDEPYHFGVSGDRARIRIMKDAFSRSSSFKKAALFEGINSVTTFWNGRVIDRQAQNGYGNAAEYWVSAFLDSRYSLTGKAGTRLLARCLRDSYDALATQADRDQISNAIVAVHASRRTQWSLQSFAKEYLDGKSKQTFLDKSPPESRSSTFSFDKTEFEAKLNFHVFRLADNVMVSAPFGTVGKSVKIEEGPQRKLKCEGEVVAETVRAKYA
jgi:hypothetical protein